MSITLQQIAILTAETLFVAGVILLLFRLRSKLGLLPLAAFVGSNQYLQTILASTHYIRFSEDVVVSPGSAVLFPAALFAVLLIYQRDGVPRARSLIYGIVISNLTLTLLSHLTSLQIRTGGVDNLLAVPEAIFQINPRVFLAGTAILLLDCLAVAIVYELLLSRWRRLPAFARLPLGFLIVLGFDSVAFSTFAFAGHPAYSAILASQLISKTLAGALYGLVLFGYLHRVDPRGESHGDGTGTGMWAILTYRERYELLRQRQEAREQAFEQERRQRQEVERLKDQFLSTVSHELRTPLTSIYGSLKLVTDGKMGALEERTARYLGVALRNARRLRWLINDILDFQKVESGRMTLDLESHDLRALVEQAIEDNQGFADRYGVELAYRHGGDAGSVVADRRWLLQVLTNLISNAVKHSPSGAAVSLSVEQRDDGVRIAVSDQGEGIPESFRDQLFQPFSQAQLGSKPEAGTGLGLSIAKAVVEKMHGTLDFESEEGQGATFFVDLPADRPAGASSGAGG